jgi:hypothetical protein
MFQYCTGLPSPDTEYNRSKQIAGSEYFKHIGSMIANDAIPTREITSKSKIVMVEAAFNKNTSPTNGP